MELETQVAKILIENPKTANSFVFALAEKSFDQSSELFSVVELPVFNPAASSDCERIAKAVAASLKRSYRRTPNESTFELALAQINEELAKLATTGQTHWIGKLNALVAVKTGNAFNIATTGKVSALLFRDGEFNNLADSPKNPHPLKTFENFATGRIKLHDFLILSTSQLFNYLSIDRMKNIIKEHTLPLAGQQIIHILQENAGPEVAFATLITLQVEPGTTPDEEIDLEEFVETKTVKGASVINKAKEVSFNFVKLAGSKTTDLAKKVFNKFKQAPKLDVKNLNVKSIVSKNKETLSKIKGGVQNATNNFSADAFKRFSRQKKFFFIAAVVLFLALIINIFVATYYTKNKAKEQGSKNLISEISKLVEETNGALLYKDDAGAARLYSEVQQKAPGLDTVTKSQEAEAKKLKEQISDLTQKMEKVTKVEAKSVATLASSESLINLPNIIATENNRNIVSYDKTSGATKDGVLVSAESIISSTFTKGSQSVIYNGQSLYLWNFSNNLLGASYSDQVPKDKNAVGLKFYSSNNKIYTIDKSTSKVLSFTVGDKNISSPGVSVQNQGDFSSAQDLAIDGNIYILLSGKILKFQSGQPQEFNLTALSKPLSEKGKIYTDVSVTSLYVLDAGNNRILVLNKKGGIVKIITSDQFTNLKDFVVDEKGKTIFVLNDTSLLKLNY